jgi:holo-[acyl-carrier protein] synthase
MSVIGHGIDLVELVALRRWIEDPRDPFVPRCFTADELAEIGEGPDRIARLAGRFAAKEAVLKALGTGFGAGVSFKDVVVRREPGGPPEVFLSGGAALAAQDLGITGWRLSISHAGGMAVASAIALGDAAQAPPPSAGPK